MCKCCIYAGCSRQKLRELDFIFSEACDNLCIGLLIYLLLVEGYMFYFEGVGERERCCDYCR